ncbi:heparinase II/III domain-containing protein [Agilicoccus flavus]|uniref:heparinase II/III domain-containing protein n=1 Tax=Agilicoccus flavus TaxID=2775968 RepID=UPI001CF66129|nr:heparinase II/III family protein [Agilicoccus flavus]
MFATPATAATTALLCLGLTASTAIASPGPTTTPDPPPQTFVAPADPGAILTPAPTVVRTSGRRLAAAAPATAPCVASAEQPVPDGAPIRIDYAPAPTFTIGAMAPEIWRKPPVADPAWLLWFYSFRWISPSVRRAVDDGQMRSRDALIGQVMEFYRGNPDRGTNAAGWDEGSSLRRLETVNCLYRMTRDPRLVAAMKAEAAVQFGPRYYGPPYRRTHNHGLMANLRLVDAGLLIGRPDWVRAASARIRAEAGSAFTRLGTSHEQSSAYQLVNLGLWAGAARSLAQLNPTDPTVRAINGTVARATNVAQWLTEPDGRLAQYGDAGHTPGMPAPARRDVGVFRDDAGGLVVGRDSWSSPLGNHYTLRYGPRQWAHGHPDKTSLTWSTAGTRVLVGTGYGANDPRSPYVTYQKSVAANNVAVPDRRRYDTRATAAVTATSLRRGTRTWVLADRAHGLAHKRTVAVTDATRTVSVSDAFARGAATQYWHLGPEWQAVSLRAGRTTMSFRHPDGRTLTIRTTGRLASAVRGATRPVAGWHFPAFGQRVPNWELRIRWTAGTATTTFQVR